jgi:oligopeptide transport system permease protein
VREALARLIAMPAARAALLFLAFLLFAVLLGPWLPGAGGAPSAEAVLLAPSAEHWLGTDSLGRDLFTRVLEGGALSLAVGFVAALVSLTLGLLYGGAAGFAGGRTESLLMRLADALYALPLFLVSALLLLLFGRGPVGIISALSLTGWVAEARLTRALVRQAKAEAYVESALSVGSSRARVLRVHILPNVLGPLLVSVTLAIPQNILAEAALSFVGIGISPPYASWGSLAGEGWRAFRTYPHLILSPGLALFLSAAAFTVLGDCLREALDPREESFSDRASSRRDRG